MSTLDPVQVEVIGSALASISEEMGEMLVKASYSPNIKERRDCTTCVFDAQGRALAQAEHIPLHLGSLMGIVAAITERYGPEDIHDGDTFVGNDPHTGGGTHLPDIVLATPVFVDGELVAWVTNLAHHADFVDRTHAHIFQEGIRIPAVRFARNWEIERDVLDLILLNCQVPRERVADFRAQLAANRLGVRRVRELCARYGADTIAAAGAELMDYTERMIRAGIAEIPDGVYSFRDLFDSDEHEGELELGVRLEVRGDEMVLDFDAPPQQPNSLNMVFTALQVTVFYAVKTVVGPDVPANDGMFRPLTVRAPRGSLLNCTPPAAVNNRILACQRVVDLVHGALAQAVPDRVIAAGNGAVTACTFSGTDPRTGEFYVYLETIGGGMGAGAHHDGLDGVQVHMTNTSNLPIECLESEYPLTVERYELIDGSGGAGRSRGGMGIRRTLRIEHDDCRAEVSTSRLLSRPWGLFGGEPGASTHIDVLDAAGRDTGRSSSAVTLHAGEAIDVHTAGAGGYGPAAERAPGAVAADERDGRLPSSTPAPEGALA
ncbi:hydantoinase B/oxoprolinase family protein [Pseudonocardia halophobica]|uniref:Methylhydantoinase n=1 Tax=Pseudonocardia halophobica TaxID=29401 RepID=A0A9W6LAD0_9PSEU|nr:hydantoinase B/oxoprolinase family protein [Pseudonocardia halophobica]GLL13629.1 methylhydantoinase [Pseudonocardia halophobica]